MTPTLTINIIKQYATPQSFKRGEAYYKNGAVGKTVRRGNDLDGEVRGSRSVPYRVRVTLGDGELGAASCTCKYEYGGICKHVVALLLAFLNNPEAFTAGKTVAEALAERSKEELVALIVAMIERQPDLAPLLERPQPVAGKRKTPVSVEPFRRELRTAFEQYGEYGGYDDWDDKGPEDAVDSVANAAAQFAARGDLRSARAIYTVILEEGLGQAEDMLEDEGEFIAALGKAVDGLLVCLEDRETAEDDVERRAIFDILLTAYIEDINLGGLGLSDGITETILAHASRADLAAIKARIIAARDKAKRGSSSRWYFQAYEEFLIELDVLDGADTETVLQRLRDEEMYEVLLLKLLNLRRGEEAAALVEEWFIGDYARLVGVNQLAQAGYREAAIRLARESVEEAYSQELINWLIQQHQGEQDREALLELLQQQMLVAPSEERYADLQACARQLGRWQAMQQQVLATMLAQKQYPALIRAYLHDGDWDAAWQTYEQHGEPQRGAHDAWLYSGLDFEIARRSQEERPARAIPVLVKYARAEIEQRSRGHYRTAAGLLAEVRNLYQLLGQEKEWQQLIAGIRTEFATLRALKDELKQAGL